MTAIVREGDVVVIDRMIVTGGVYTHGAYSESRKPILYYAERDFYYTAVQDNSVEILPEELELIYTAYCESKNRSTTAKVRFSEKDASLDTLSNFVYFFKDTTMQFSVDNAMQFWPSDIREIFNVSNYIAVYMRVTYPELSIVDFHNKLVGFYKYASNGKQGHGDLTMLSFKE